MIHIAVCDDEPAITEAIMAHTKEILKAHQIDHHTEGFLSGKALCSRVEGGEFFDLVFLDLMMDGCSGIDVERTFRQEFHNSRTIFICVSANKRQNSLLFEYGTWRFIEKPINWNQFQSYLLDACRQLHLLSEANFRFKQVGGEEMELPIRKIKYFESQAHRLVIHAAGGLTFGFIDKMARVYERMEPYDFIWVHQSFVVNYNEIAGLKSTQVLLKDGETIPISKKRRESTLDRYKAIRMKRGISWIGF